MTRIYHNARCSKSRACVAFAQNAVNDVEMVNYLENPPSVKELTRIIELLKVRPIDIVRTGEKLWIENFSTKSLSDQQLIVTMCTHPILIQRPIVITEHGAYIARDPEVFEKIFAPLFNNPL